MKELNNIQEIIYNIISNQQMSYMRTFLKSLFPFKEMLLHIEKSIMKIDELEINNKDMKFQDFEEIRDDQYINLTSIYIQVYLNNMYSESNKELVAKEFNEKIALRYIEMLDDFGANTDFTDTYSMSKSKLRFLMIYMKQYICYLKTYLNLSEDSKYKNSLLRNNTGVEYSSQAIRTRVQQSVNSKLSKIDDAYSVVLRKLEESNNEDLDEELWKIRELSNDSLVKEKLIKISNTKTLKSKESLYLCKIWKNYVNYIVSNRKSRQLVEKEQASFVNLIFTSIVDKSLGRSVARTYKRFIGASITYSYLSEITRWNLYIIMFIFKINSMLLVAWNKKLSSEYSEDITDKINSEILNSFDSLRISNMIF